MTDDQAPHRPPQPDPALSELDFLVGTWSIRGKMAGSDEENIVGTSTFEWLPGGFFLRQVMRIDFAGQFQAEGEELIGYDADTGKFPSYVFSNSSPEPLPYEYEVKDRSMKITVSHGILDATFTGEVREDRKTYSGGWRPNAGADPTVNLAYDIRGERVG